MSTLVTPTDGHGGKAKILDSGSGSSSRSFAGRVAHFWSVLNPLNCLASNDELEAAKSLLTTEPKDDVLRSDEFQRAATLYESAYHPDTGERIHLVGRMCFQAPGCAVLAASMLAFHSSLPLTLGLQWANQSFMAMCNYSNRNAADERSRADASVLPAYLSATFGSMLTAWSLKKMLPKRYSVLVPAASISVASLVNVPCMRSEELLSGLVVEDSAGHVLDTKSHLAACFAVAAVTTSRILNGCADLVVAPAVVGLARLRGYKWAKSTNPAVTVPLYTTLCFATLSISTPVTSAIAPQRASLSAKWLSDDINRELVSKDAQPVVYFNKGL